MQPPIRPGHEKLDTHQKALAVNLDSRRYGTFAEIGAGQEVVRWFFRVGGAAGNKKVCSRRNMHTGNRIIRSLWPKLS